MTHGVFKRIGSCAKIEKESDLHTVTVKDKTACSKDLTYSQPSPFTNQWLGCWFLHRTMHNPVHLSFDKIPTTLIPFPLFPLGQPFFLFPQ